jgi:hypothetical protein
MRMAYPDWDFVNIGKYNGGYGRKTVSTIMDSSIFRSMFTEKPIQFAIPA